MCSSIREQGGTSRAAGRSMNCTSGLAVVSHRGGGASPDACGPDIPAFDRPRSTSGAAYPSGSRVPARHRSRMGLAAWSRCMTARSTSGDSPNHGPTLALFDCAVRNWGTRTQRNEQRPPRALRHLGGGCLVGRYPQFRCIYLFADIHLRIMWRRSSARGAIKSVVTQAHPRVLRA